MIGSMRTPEPSAREGSGWLVFENLANQELADSTAVDQMSHEQLMVFALNMLRQEVNSGGFDVYFRYSGGNTALHAAEAARIVLPGWSGLIDDACRTMGAPYPADVDSRERVVDLLAEEDPELFSSLDDRLYQLEEADPADEQIDRFIWSNKPAFFV